MLNIHNWWQLVSTMELFKSSTSVAKIIKVMLRSANEPLHHPSNQFGISNGSKVLYLSHAKAFQMILFVQFFLAFFLFFFVRVFFFGCLSVDNTLFTFDHAVYHLIRSIGDCDLALLTVSQDGFVMKYSVVNSPHLDGRQQMRVRRIQGDVEGIKTDAKDILENVINR